MKKSKRINRNLSFIGIIILGVLVYVFGTSVYDGLNTVLPPDIVVKYAQTVAADFHARHSAVGKRYRYLISNLPYKPPFSLNQSWWVSQDLDIDLMREAADLLVGKHDFSAFRAASCSSPSSVKDLRVIEIFEVRSRHSTLQIEMEANSFLQHMVRIIAGTLVEVGRGYKNVEDVAQALEKRSTKAGRKNCTGTWIVFIECDLS